MNTILVTGATGTVGSTVVSLLENQDVTVRALVRDPAHAPGIPGGRRRITRADFAYPDSLRAAMQGVDAVFLACGNVPEQVRYECAVIDAAARAGVRRIVKLSARGAAMGAPVAYWDWHGRIERHLHSSGVGAVVLRPGFLMTNLLAAAGSVREQGMIFAPAGAARIAMIDPADVAAVAAVALTTDAHDGRTYVLTGPEAITYRQVALALSGATGREVGYVDIPREAAGPALAAAGLPPFAAEAVLDVFDDLRRGGQESLTGSVHDILGRAARPFASFAADHAGAFGGERPAALSA
jgi:uncharacterized protein YbjT (DUF2867 family)